jgi:hypothetical protein
MEPTATILHADLDAFYASEQLLDPSLRGKPIAVGSGVVLAASYEARALGIRGGMPARRARELCPHLIFVSGHFKDYQRLGDAAIQVVGDFTPLCWTRRIRTPTGNAVSLAAIRRADRSDRRSSPLSTPLRSPSRTSPWRRCSHTPPRWHEAASATRRSGRRGCPST